MKKAPEKTVRLHSWFALRTEIDRILFLTVLFNFLMVVIRILWSGDRTFIFMPWNLFLALVPYLLSKWLTGNPRYIESRWRFSLIFAAWIFFIPNAFYIITDLFHLIPRQGVPLWYDLILLMSFAWSGLIMGVLSVRHMEKAIAYHISSRSELLFIYPIMWLNALGVYIGRYFRYNTWDIVWNPFSLMADIARMIFHPLRHGAAWTMIFFFSILMTLIYLSIKKVSKIIS
jgi:uncharacterized membrane protein